MTSTKSKPNELTKSRRTNRHGCWEHLIVAPLWVAYEANLGTLMRTCDAVGACIAVPNTDHYRQALDKGDTLVRYRPHVHWVQDKNSWLNAQHTMNWDIAAVELAEDATPLTMLEPAKKPTILLLGHEREGIPVEWVGEADYTVQIPMFGKGASLNVAVAGSLVLYRLAGLS